MTVNDILHATKRGLQDNSAGILTALSITGVASTGYLAARAGYQAGEKIRIIEWKIGTAGGFKQRFKERAKETWTLYIPAGISGALTVAGIVIAARSNSRRATAAYTLLSVSERAFEEYREKVVEKLGDNKERAVRDEIAQDRVNASPPNSVIIMGAGDVLCREDFTGRYFQSSMEVLMSAQNKVNAKLLRNDQASLSDFYELIGIPETSDSDEVGWTTPQLMELKFSSVLSRDGRPCLVFNYDHMEVF